MKIALDGSLLGARFSGVERSVGQLLQHLPEAAGGHELVVFVGDAFDRYVEQYLPGGLDPRLTIVRSRFDNTDRLGRVWWQQVVLPRLAQGCGAAVFHAPAYVASAWTGLPSVVTLYDLQALAQPELTGAANRLHYKLAVPAGVKRAARVIVPSDATRREVARYLPAAYERTVTIPLGVEARFGDTPDETDAALRERHNLPESYLLWVGNVEAKKNLSVLLRALHLLRGRRVEVPKLVLAGELGQHSNDLMAEFLSAGLQGRVVFLGRVRDVELPALYRGARAFLFPSLTEGFGLPPLEAMASGVPVAVADRGALPEVAGRAALVVRATDPEAWAEAIGRLHEDEELRASLRARGRSVAAEYSWRRTAEATFKVYQAVAAEGADEYDPRSGRLLHAAD